VFGPSRSGGGAGRAPGPDGGRTGPPYRRVAETRYFDSAGRLRDTEPSPPGGLTDKVRGHAAGIASFEPGTDGFTDHFIDAYIDRLEAAAR
jgi:hypothetical protein